MSAGGTAFNPSNLVCWQNGAGWESSPLGGEDKRNEQDSRLEGMKEGERGRGRPQSDAGRGRQERWRPGRQAPAGAEGWEKAWPRVISPVKDSA